LSNFILAENLDVHVTSHHRVPISKYAEGTRESST